MLLVEASSALETIARAVMDRGYAYATLKSEAQVDLGAHVIDYAVMLYELVESGDATEEEAEAFRVLSGRLTPLAEATAQPSTQKRRPRRRRGSGSGHWRHRGTQASGSAPLSAA